MIDRVFRKPSQFEIFPIISIDLETFLMKMGQVAPQFVCLGYSFTGERAHLLGSENLIEIEEFLIDVLNNNTLVFANASYDLTVIATNFPSIVPNIFKALEQGKVRDILIREKLHDISTHGSIVTRPNKYGKQEKISYSLASLTKRYFNKNRFEEKKDASSWRLRFSELVGMPISSYPKEAKKYLIDDVLDTFNIFHKQEEIRKSLGYGSMNTETFQVSVDFALRLMTCRGLQTDQERVKHLEKVLEKELSLQKMKPLIEAGIIREPQASRSYKRGKGQTKPTEESVNKAALQCLIQDLSAELNIPIKYTETFQISTDKDVCQRLSSKSKLIELFANRQKYLKLQTTYLPPLKHEIVHPNFNVLVESGRTSSYGYSDKKKKLYPSTNGQNWPRISGNFSARECIVSRPGYLILSVDYSALELCSVAQVTYNLFGASVHRDKINAGYDLHAYLGSVLASTLDSTFHSIVISEINTSENDEICYDLFRKLRDSDKLEDRNLYKHYRTFAKPTGLGYPGGLGPHTFIDFARISYGVEVNLQQAKLFRELWLSTYPEMVQFFRWVTEQQDPNNVEKYSYTSSLGMYRAGVSYCSTANGKAMQTLSAEGAKKAVFAVSRACYDKTLDSCLYGCYPLSFIHDEILLEIPDDKWTSERADEVARIMISEMQTVMPDVTITVNPSLMFRWYKEAETIYDEEGQLMIWKPD